MVKHRVPCRVISVGNLRLLDDGLFDDRRDCDTLFMTRV